MAAFRARAAAAPREASPMPPAKRGLLNKASRLRIEVGGIGTGGIGGLDMLVVMKSSTSTAEA